MGISNNSLLSIFNKIVRQEIDVSNYSINKSTSNLQGSVFNSPLQIGNTVKGDSPSIAMPLSGYFGDFEVVDQGSTFLITIQAGIYNGISWGTKEFIINKFSDDGLFEETRFFIIYIDTAQESLILKQFKSTTEIDSTNFILMLAVLPPGATAISYNYNDDETYSKFIYGYQANFLYYMLMYSSFFADVIPEFPANKIVGNLTIEGTTTITSESESVLLTSDGMYIFDVANVTSLGLEDRYEQSMLASFNKTGLYFYDGAGTVLSKFTKDEASIAGWVLNAEHLQSGDASVGITISSVGGIYTNNFVATTLVEKANGAWEIDVAGTGWGITPEGDVEFNDAIFRGKVFSPYGNIGGWEVIGDHIANGNIVLDSQGEIYTKSYKDSGGTEGWLINYLGEAYFLNVFARGRIEALEGTIGGWTINETSISSTNLLLSPTGGLQTVTFSQGVGELPGVGWKIGADGNAYFNDVTVYGTLYSTSGKISGWEITENYIANGNIVLNTSGEIYTANYVTGVSGWKIRYDGFAEFANALIRGTIYATLGTIGGWTISSTAITSSGTPNIIIDSTGSIRTSNFVLDTSGWKIQSNGDAEFNGVKVRGTIYASSGFIGASSSTGWTISSDKLARGTDIELDAFAKQIKIANSALKIGKAVSGSNDGIYFGTNNYWLTNNTFKVGSSTRYLSWNGSTLELNGNIIAIGGTIGGWTIDSTSIRNSTSTIILNSSDNRYEIKGTGGSLKLAVGYLGNITGHDASQFGIYVGAADAIYIEAPADRESIQHISGDWIVQNDANIIIRSGSNTLLRLGSQSGNRGLYLYNTSGTVLSEYTSTHLKVGNNYLYMDGTLLLNVNGTDMKFGNAAGGLGLHGLKITNTDYIYSSGNFSLGGGKLTWNGTTLSVEGSGQFTGTIYATLGTVGGWTIGANTISKGTDIVLNGTDKQLLINNGAIKLGFNAVGAGLHGLLIDSNNYWYRDTSDNVRFQLGTKLVWDGSDLVINGSITATSGTIAGWVIGSTTISKTINGAGFTLDSGLGQISISGVSTTLKIGHVVDGVNSGIYLNANNYWLTNGNSKFGGTTQYIQSSSSGVEIAAQTFSLSTSNLVISSADSSIVMGNLKLIGGSIPQLQLNATAYENIGVWIGIESGTAKLSAVSATSWVKFNGTSVDIKSDTFNLTTGSGQTIGIDSSVPRLYLGNMASYSTVSGKGFFVGKVGSYYNFKVGSNTSGGVLSKGLAYDGTTDSLSISADTFSLIATGITIDSLTPKIMVGSSSYGTSGIWMGKDGIPYKFSLYNDSSNYLLWDGSKLAIKADNFELDSSGKLTATNASISGTLSSINASLGGWIVGATTISSSNTVLKSGSSPYIGIKATNFMQKGIWFGESSYRNILPFFMSANSIGNITVSDSLATTTTYIMFDGNLETEWSQTHGSATVNIDIDFGEAKKAKGVRIYCPEQAASPTASVIYGSNNGSSWTALKSTVHVGGISGYSIITFTNTVNYRYYRVSFINYVGSTIKVSSIIYYLDVEYQDDPSKITASSTYSTFVPSNAFDVDTSTSWIVTHNNSTQWLKVELDNLREITSYRFYSSNADTPKTWTFEGSYDNINWEVLDTRSAQILNSSTWYSYTCSNSGMYKYYRWVFTGYNGSTYLRLTEVEMITSDNYAFSVSNGSNSYISWDDSLKLKGNLYISDGDSGIYFEDTALSIEDGYEPTIARSDGSIAFYKGLQIKDSNKKTLFGFLGENMTYSPLLILKEPDDRCSSILTTSYLRFDCTDLEDYSARGILQFVKLTGNYNYGYFKSDSPINVLYDTGKNASDMPNGTILVQGSYLYYKDSSGVWKRAATYNATPS